MNLSILKLSNLHLTSGISALALHVGIASFALLPSDPVVINQQAINVSFVAPSSSHKSQNRDQQKIALNVDNKNAIKAAQNKQESKSEDNNESAANKETSGRQDQKATATRAAESEPVFNADYLNNPAPIYPRSAKNGNIQGKVLLNVVVKTDGKPARIAVSRSSGSSILDEAALDAVKEWRFVPAKKNGHSVEASVIVPIDFKII